MKFVYNNGLSEQCHNNILVVANAISPEIARSVHMTEWLVHQTSDHEVLGSNRATGRPADDGKCFIVQSLPLLQLHCLGMTDNVEEDVKLQIIIW